MEKILTIDGREVRFKSTAALPLHYATHFGSDILADSLAMGESKGENTIQMFRMLWTMAYCADKTIPAMEQWLDGFENFPIYMIFPELSEMFWAAMRGVTGKN